MRPTKKPTITKEALAKIQSDELNDVSKDCKKDLDDFRRVLLELSGIGLRLKESLPAVLLDELEALLLIVVRSICDGPNRLKHKGGRPAKQSTRLRRLEFVVWLHEELEALGVRYDDSTDPKVIAKAKRKASERIIAEANLVETDDFVDVDVDDLLHDFNRRTRTSKQSLRKALQPSKPDKLT